MGDINVNIKTGRVETVYDVASLFIQSQIKCRLRQVAGTREAALRSFGPPFNAGPLTSERLRAQVALLDALYLPTNLPVDIQMSAPGGSNGGVGYLWIFEGAFERGKDPAIVHMIYPRPNFVLGGVGFTSNWARLNTQGFRLDSNGIPYLKVQ